jgi:hypothetical protein
MKTIEKMAFDKLVKIMPDLKRSSLKTTICDAIKWGYGDSDYFDDELLRFGKPPFVPDATRFRKMMREGGSKREPIVEIWEIEDSSKITHEKMDRIFTWWAHNFDGAEIPFFELWTTDRWGNNRNKVWCDYDEYNRSIDTFVPYCDLPIEAVLI